MTAAGIWRLGALLTVGVSALTLVEAPDDLAYELVSRTLGTALAFAAVIWAVGRVFPARPDDPPAREVTAHVHVPFPPERVWAFVEPPEHAPLHSAVLRGYREPGTPQGVGERRTFVERWGGRRRTVEVVEYVAGRRLVVTPVVEGRAVLDAAQTVRTVDPDGEGTRLGLGFRMPPEAAADVVLPPMSGARELLEKHLAETAAALARWDGPPAA